MRRLLVTLILASGLITCENVLVNPGFEDTPSGNFDALWSDFDRTYPFFGIKNVDWDLLYNSISPSLTPATTNAQLFDAMVQLLEPLRDPHVSLQSPFGSYRFEPVFSAPANVLSTDELQAYVPDLTDAGALSWGHLADGIVYIKLGSFGGSMDRFAGIDAIVSASTSAPGIILDIRDNGGGSNSNSNLILSRFMDQRRLVRSVRYRNGPDHDDFGAPIHDHVSPGGPTFLGPLVVLTNRKTASAAEDFLLGIRTLPHAEVVGDTTAGTSSNPVERTLSNGWTYRVPQWIQTDPDGVAYEDQGIPPDMPRWITAQESANGVDAILEMAAERIRNRSL